MGRDEAALKARRGAPPQSKVRRCLSKPQRGQERSQIIPETLADFNQALELNPDNGGIHLGRGFSKFYLGDKTGACEDWMLGSAHGVSNAAELSTEYCKE